MSQRKVYSSGSDDSFVLMKATRTKKSQEKARSACLSNPHFSHINFMLNYFIGTVITSLSNSIFLLKISVTGAWVGVSFTTSLSVLMYDKLYCCPRLSALIWDFQICLGFFSLLQWVLKNFKILSQMLCIQGMLICSFNMLDLRF